MLEHSQLPPVTRDAARRHRVRTDTAERLLREAGWVVYRGLVPRMNGDVTVFCRSQRSFQTRMILVKADRIDQRLASHL